MRSGRTQAEADSAFRDYMNGEDRTSHKASRRQHKADDAYMVWTKRCSDGTACAGSFGDPSFIPDEYEICDHCLLARYMPNARPTYDGCSDPYGMDNLYREEDVVEALRSLSGS